jgi:hypothetical protein
MTRNAAIEWAIAAIDADAWTPVRYPGAVIDPDTGEWISDGEVAEIPYTAFASTSDAITARLVVRRVNDARYRDALFPVCRYHPFLTNTDLPVEQADITHSCGRGRFDLNQRVGAATVSCLRNVRRNGRTVGT